MGFLLTTKIQDYLEAVQPDPHAAESILESPNPRLFSELSLKVNANITEYSLQYVYDIWQSLAVQFRLPLPALLFHKITKGCFTVTLRVLSSLIPHLHEKLFQSSSFFNEKQIWEVTLFSDSKECLYSVKRKHGAKVN